MSNPKKEKQAIIKKIRRTSNTAVKVNLTTQLIEKIKEEKENKTTNDPPPKG